MSSVLWLRHGCMALLPYDERFVDTPAHTHAHGCATAASPPRDGASPSPPSAVLRNVTEAIYITCEDGTIPGLPQPPTCAQISRTSSVVHTHMRLCVEAFKRNHPHIPVIEIRAASLDKVPEAIVAAAAGWRHSAILTGPALDAVTRSVDVEVARVCEAAATASAAAAAAGTPSSIPPATSAGSSDASASSGVVSTAWAGLWRRNNLLLPAARVTSAHVGTWEQFHAHLENCMGELDAGAGAVVDARADAAPMELPELWTRGGNGEADLRSTVARITAIATRPHDDCAPTEEPLHAGTVVKLVPWLVETALLSWYASHGPAGSGTTADSAGRSSPVSRKGAYLPMCSSTPRLQALVCTGVIDVKSLWRAAATCARAVKNVDSVADAPSDDALAAVSAFMSATLDWLAVREFAHHLLRAQPRLRYEPGNPALCGAVPWCKDDLAAPEAAQREKLPERAAPARRAAASNGGWFSSGLTALGLQSTPEPQPAPASPGVASRHAVDPNSLSLRDLASRNRSDAHVSETEPQNGGAMLASSCIGLPLVDAAMRCLLALGYCPAPLIALLQVVWCKYLQRSWTEGMRAFAYWDLTVDTPLAVLQWQWNVGLAAACSWNVPVNPPGPLAGWFDEPAAGREASSTGSSSLATHAVANHQSWRAWPRFSPALPPHAHALAHPAGHEFALGPDAYGAFVRTWLSRPAHVGTACIRLPPDIPDAYVYCPHAAPSTALSSTGVRLVDARTLASASSSDSWGLPPLAAAPIDPAACIAFSAEVVDSRGCVYPAPFVTPAAARKASLAAVLAAHTTASHEHLAASSWLSDMHPSRHHGAHTTVRRYLRGQQQAGYNARWGTVETFPVIVEEDSAVLVEQLSTRAEDGWEQIVDDPERLLRVFMQARDDSQVKTVLARATLSRHACDEVFDAMTVLRKYQSWDLTWHQVSIIGEPLDMFNEPYYFVADPPPPPYSYVITQRDFVMLRHVFRDPHTGMGAIAHRNACHNALPHNTKFIRGEALGIVGFTVAPVQPGAAVTEASLPDGSVVSSPAATSPVSPGTPRGTSAPGAHVVLVTAADPKGAIPGYLVNFVAKRTPRMWVDRLTQACDRFASEK